MNADEDVFNFLLGSAMRMDAQTMRIASQM